MNWFVNNLSTWINNRANKMDIDSFQAKTLKNSRESPPG